MHVSVLHQCSNESEWELCAVSSCTYSRLYNPQSTPFFSTCLTIDNKERARLERFCWQDNRNKSNTLWNPPPSYGIPSYNVFKYNTNRPLPPSIREDCVSIGKSGETLAVSWAWYRSTCVNRWCKTNPVWMFFPTKLPARYFSKWQLFVTPHLKLYNCVCPLLPYGT